MIKVVIADDHPLIQKGIKTVLNDEIDIELCATAKDSDELMALLENHLPDILIMDMDMPGRSGLDLLKDVKKWYPKLPVIILTIHPAERFAVRALKAGASGYLCKSDITDELAKAIRTVLQRKKRYITPEVAELLALQIDNNKQREHEMLTDREYDVFYMIAKGESINHIAEKLSISPSTVYTYRSRIKEKMALDSNVEIARYAIDSGLIT